MDEATTRIEQKLATYAPSIEVINLVQQTPILLLAGISGAGKDSIKTVLLKMGKYHRIISHTTRAPRNEHGQRERHGVDYHFVDVRQAESMVDQRAFVEAKLYGGNIYGTSASEIKQANQMKRIAVADVDVHGVAEYLMIDANIRPVFVLPPDYDTWQVRLRQRYAGSLQHDDLERRMLTALCEIDHALRSPHFRFVINQELADAAAYVDRLVSGKSTLSHQDTEARQIAEAIRSNIHAAYPALQVAA